MRATAPPAPGVSASVSAAPTPPSASAAPPAPSASIAPPPERFVPSGRVRRTRVGAREVAWGRGLYLFAAPGDPSAPARLDGDLDVLQLAPTDGGVVALVRRGAERTVERLGDDGAAKVLLPAAGALSPDGRRAARTRDGRLELVDLASGEVVAGADVGDRAKVETPNEAVAVEGLVPDTALAQGPIVVSRTGGRVSVHRWSDGAEIQRRDAPVDDAYARGRTVVLVRTFEASVTVLDGESGKVRRSWTVPRHDSPQSPTFRDLFWGPDESFALVRVVRFFRYAPSVLDVGVHGSDGSRLGGLRGKLVDPDVGPDGLTWKLVESPVGDPPPVCRFLSWSGKATACRPSP